MRFVSHRYIAHSLGPQSRTYFSVEMAIKYKVSVFSVFTSISMLSFDLLPNSSLQTRTVLSRHQRALLAAIVSPPRKAARPFFQRRNRWTCSSPQQKSEFNKQRHKLQLLRNLVHRAYLRDRLSFQLIGNPQLHRGDLLHFTGLSLCPPLHTRYSARESAVWRRPRSSPG